jgi:hypothetical protein
MKCLRGFGWNELTGTAAAFTKETAARTKAAATMFWKDFMVNRMKLDLNEMREIDTNPCDL